MLPSQHGLSRFLSAFQIRSLKCHGDVVSISNLARLPLELCFHPHPSAWPDPPWGLSLTIVVDSNLLFSHLHTLALSPQLPGCSQPFSVLILFSHDLVCTQQSKDLFKANIKHIYRGVSRTLQRVSRALLATVVWHVQHNVGANVGPLLLTKLHTLDFTSLPSVSTLFQDSTVYLVIAFPRLLLASTVSQALLIYNDCFL